MFINSRPVFYWKVTGNGLNFISCQASSQGDALGFDGGCDLFELIFIMDNMFMVQVVKKVTNLFKIIYSATAPDSELPFYSTIQNAN